MGYNNIQTPSSAPLVFELAELQALSNCLLTVARTARQPASEHLLLDSMLTLKTMVPFRSAWWGECSDVQPGIPRMNWAHGRINLSDSFARDWGQLASVDTFAAESMNDCGRVVRNSGHDGAGHEMMLFSQRYDLFHAMAVTMKLADSGLMFFVSLYRSENSAAFDEHDSVLFSAFFTHLLHHWEVRVREALGHTVSSSFERFALTNAVGELLYVGKQLGAAIYQTYPEWTGSRLPVRMLPALGQVPGVIAVGRCKLKLQPYGTLVALAMDDGLRESELPPRERTVAILYSQGQSYKVIARQLDLSPATVRTYLRNAYLQLGVRNKIELGQALRSTSASAYGYP
ncbi:MAG: LuxR C-terminal-related transcriptional regulator [Pseudomonadota bacterium]